MGFAKRHSTQVIENIAVDFKPSLVGEGWVRRLKIVSFFFAFDAQQ